MAWFHFCTSNHNEVGRLTLVDMFDWFEAGLLDLGHRVTLSDSRVEPNAINVFWECFVPATAAELVAADIVYGIVATEIPDGSAFNWQTSPAVRTRFESFITAAQRASFIWTMVESGIPFYSQFGPVAYLPIGFSERLIPAYIDQPPDIDFCFFGNHLPYREALIEELRKHAQVEWPATFLPSVEVGQLIARSKIGLGLKQAELWPVPSPTRFGRLMMAKRGIAAEHVSEATRQGEIVGLCPQGHDFVDYALGMLHSDWRTRADQVFERYRAEMPMREIMEGVLDRTVSRLPA